MTAGRICVREVDFVSAGETVRVAASRMHARNVGSLVVLDADRKPVGIITDRDLAVRVVAEGIDGAQTTVSQVMSATPKTIRENTPIEEALARMRTGPYRRIPVVDPEGKLVGLLSLDDILDLLFEEFGQIRELLSKEGPASLGRV